MRKTVSSSDNIYVMSHRQLKHQRFEQHSNNLIAIK